MFSGNSPRKESVLSVFGCCLWGFLVEFNSFGRFLVENSFWDFSFLTTMNYNIYFRWKRSVSLLFFLGIIEERIVWYT